MRAPRATYRIQFHTDFPFSAGEALGPYLKALGISHVYASPILTARAGSNHGYDVVDFSAINPELGGEAAFRSMAAALRAHDIGIILDIVPNHMAVGGADNRLWLDVLENGRDSAYASWFDIDFDVKDADLNGKVCAPYLGASYGAVLAAGDLQLVEDDALGKLAVAYHHHRFPIRPQDVDTVRAAGLARFAEPQELHALLERQNFRLAWWRTAGDRVNYRRFFDITELAGVRIENDEAFDASHRIAFGLYAEGLIDGVRIDHIDGLTDPAGYCQKLRARLANLQTTRPADREEPAFIVVEKILAGDEWLPEDWPVDGTTGYDFMNEVSALQHDDAGKASLQSGWTNISGRHGSFENEETEARREMLRVNFNGQLATVVDAMATLRDRQGGDRDLTDAALHRAVASLVQHFRVYRVYATGKAGSPPPGSAFEAAMAGARQEPSADDNALDFIDGVMRDAGDDADVARAIRRFNQLTAPIAAKAVEDTAFYRYGRLLSRNDVGFDAETLGTSVEAFHERMILRAARAPRSMLATATHDHKRGEDVRARLAVISERPDAWRDACAEWSGMNAAIRPPRSDAGDEAMLYQMIAGAWPLDLAADDEAGLAEFARRLAGWREKSMREAKLRSTWLQPDAENEAAAQGFLSAALDPARSAVFLRDMAAFVRRIAPAGALNGLVQLALRLTLPGIPDTYQGTELWDFSLVDPDNRRPVDYDLRRRLLEELPATDSVETWHEGRIKLHLMRELLALRGELPELFADGDYQPIDVAGARAGHALVFRRQLGAQAVVVAVALRCSAGLTDGRLKPDADWWGETAFLLPPELAALEPVIGGSRPSAGTVRLAEAFGTLPVAVWRSES